MKKSIFMALAGVMMVSSAAHAISVTGEAGEHYTNLGVGFGTESTGLAVSGNWLHSDNFSCFYRLESQPSAAAPLSGRQYL